MRNEFRRAVLFTVTAMVLFGGVYHVFLWGVARMVFAEQAQGSLVRRADGTVIGSMLIAQPFGGAEYFHPRPSAVDYNAAAAGGSNYAPSNPEYLAAVRKRLAQVMASEGVSADEVPSELVTTSGGGLDPHLSPAGAVVQSARVASARGIPGAVMRRLIADHTEPPLFGLFGGSRVNVLELNLALDAAWPKGTPGGDSRRPRNAP